MRILVTGGCGFIGSNFINLIHSKSEVECIVNLDIMSYASDENNVNIEVREDKKYTLIRGDINDINCLSYICQRFNIDTVVHFAAESHVDRSIEGASQFIHTNINGTFTLLNFFLGNWKSTEGKKFLHVSTDEVFGDLGDGDFPFTKQHPYKPNSPYAASKASSDLLCRSFNRTHGFPVMITNCSNNFGPRQFPEKLIPLAIKKLKNNEKIPVYGIGMNIRDWIYVEDHCRCLWEVLKRGDSGGQYLIGGNNEIKNLELVKSICKLCDKDPNESIKFVEDRKGHDFRYAIDNSDFERYFGLINHTPFEKSLKDTITWYWSRF